MAIVLITAKVDMAPVIWPHVVTAAQAPVVPSVRHGLAPPFPAVPDDH